MQPVFLLQLQVQHGLFLVFSSHVSAPSGWHCPPASHSSRVQTSSSVSQLVPVAARIGMEHSPVALSHCRLATHGSTGLGHWTAESATGSQIPLRQAAALKQPTEQAVSSGTSV